MKTQAERLKETREERGLNQQELADRLHISQSFIGALETGRQKTSKWLPEIAGILRANETTTSQRNGSFPALSRTGHSRLEVFGVCGFFG
jgi:transcriptional regulator with XRE-family HTH domain